MLNISLKIDQGIPQYACSSCSSCCSIFGKSLCNIKDRGCCWYFPKFTLYEIHKMAISEEGLKVLDTILKLPETKVYNYYIHAKGYFDKEGYNEYLERGDTDAANVEDKTIFFRACPFINPGVGCNLPHKYRSYICNFYLCNEISRQAEQYEVFKDYIKERNYYAKWIEWENRSLEMMLKEEGINLIQNFSEVLCLLKSIPIEEYEFPKLKPIEDSIEISEINKASEELKAELEIVVEKRDGVFKERGMVLNDLHLLFCPRCGKEVEVTEGSLKGSGIYEGICK